MPFKAILSKWRQQEYYNKPITTGFNKLHHFQGRHHQPYYSTEIFDTSWAVVIAGPPPTEANPADVKATAGAVPADATA
ncbi:MAG TPA: hypothetical protein VHM26_13050 [Chitinophagaceae bacterium]|nr:hypothetical protein [Chitinophagaceae bacterium]